MENEIYERDYTGQGNATLEYAEHKGADAFWRTVLGSKKALEYEDKLKSFPKKVYPAAKGQYDDALKYLDAVARKTGGRIKGIVDFEKYYAEIVVEVPFFELALEGSRVDDMWQIFLWTDYMSVTPISSERVRLTFRTELYFLDVLNEDEQQSLRDSGAIEAEWLFNELCEQNRLWCDEEENE